MLDLVITAVVAAPAIQLAADIATWCFKQGAKAERARQREIIRNTRAAVAAERRAAHQAHYEMLGECWDTVQEMRSSSRAVTNQFQAVLDQNRAFLRSLALTPEQRLAIHECNDQLERGIQRLRAYIGPYTQYYLNEIHDAQLALRSHSFITPDLPEAILPDDFPFGGELLEFDNEELVRFPFVDLGHQQRGRFISPSLKTVRPSGPLMGLIQRYDREHGFWIISAAAGALANDLKSGDAYRSPRSITMAEWRGDYRVGWWEHVSGERLMIRLDSEGLTQRMRRAPWGTPAQIHIHAADFFLRSIRGGQTVAREHRYPSWRIPCNGGNEFWEAYETAAQFSDKLLIRECGMKDDPQGISLVLRLATGHEFPIVMSRSSATVTVLPQSGMRLGLVQEANRNFLVFLLRGTLTTENSPNEMAVAALHSAIEDSFAEQRDLLRLAEADSLDLKKYRAVLQAEFETARQRDVQVIEFYSWHIPAELQRGKFSVRFRISGNVGEGRAVRLTGEEGILGWCGELAGGQDELPINVLFEKRKAFRDDSFPQQGKLEVIPVDRELQSKIDAIENFLSAASVETRSAEEQRAFSRLRRELLGEFEAEPTASRLEHNGKGCGTLDVHQERAIGLVSGTAPLVLIQGPPGTGKTHVIAHAINRILRRDPKARVAITSQANPAVDEAIAKIQESFPEVQVYRDYSAAAKEKYSTLDRGVGLEQYHSHFIQRIEEAREHSDVRIAHIQRWLKGAIQNAAGQIERDVHRILSARSQVVACTLSRLATLSNSAPPFDLVIVDEAAKASVPEAMIAANCAKRLALVGDHHQLLPYLDESYYEHSAPTQEDKQLLKDLWNDSLFSRLWRKAPDSRKAFLAVMRRSRKAIAECISACFYEKALLPGRDNHSFCIRHSKSLIWLDSSATEHRPAGRTTISNRGEVELVLQSLDQLARVALAPIKVAVIAFHRGQAELLTNVVRHSRSGISPSVLTVDASQGGQWDAVILSLARTRGYSGFVGNPNRMNVAISRAKEICIIIGSLSYAKLDRSADSCLSKIVNFIELEPRTGKWVCYPVKGRVPAGFSLH